jgi:thymidylate synthase
VILLAKKTPWLSSYPQTLEEALQMTLEDIKEFGIAASPRGRGSKEIIGYHYNLEDPLYRIVGLKARNLNPFYLVGNLLWVLKQSNKLEMINYYNPKGSMFSDDGEILRGAYGKRIFDFDGVNQWHQVVKELKTDPDSRRAIITFHLPQHDWTGSLDTPCTASIQFFIRNGYLHMINHMRSQSAAFVQPYDVFLMTMLQEILANELGIEIGEYQHFCGSMHYFSNEEKMVDSIIESNDYTDRMPEMPKESNMQNIRKLLEFEQEVRMDAINQFNRGLNADYTYYLFKLAELKLPVYWVSIGEVLIAKAIHFTSGKGAVYTNFVYGLKSNPFQKLMLQFN